METNTHILEVARRNQEQARQVVRESGIYAAWESIGAKVNLIGSLKMGLLVTHRDIDFHIYTPQLNVVESFSAVTRLAQNPSVTRVEFRNLIDTEEKCLEWHAWYLDALGEEWQLDMIHILEGSNYDGYMERVSDRIMEAITPRQREIVMRLKYETPETEKIAGIEYYQAVMRDGIEDYASFARWREDNPLTGVVHWIP